jgi:perosamine synthetase
MATIKWWEPIIGSEEKKYINQVLDNNFPNEGPLTTKFEEQLTKLLGCRHVIATTSATAAMFLSLKALGVGYGDEVIVPDMTFISTANAVEMTGAKPVLADVDKTLNIDPEAFSKAITEKTKAVMPVHVTGRAADVDAIMKIADENNIFVAEDAAEAFMSKHEGKCLGTFGKLGCFSFSPHKTITTGQGGAIAINDDTLYVRLKELKDQGRPKRGTGGDDVHHSIGYNFKFTDLQAAVGLGQLNYLDSRIERLRKNYKLYAENLKDVDGISVFKFDDEEVPQWTDAIVEKRDKLDKFLGDNEMECRRFWFPLHTQVPYKLPDDNFPNSTSLSKKALWLPSAFTLTDEDIISVCNKIKEFK